jgi:hypothetical protein
MRHKERVAALTGYVRQRGIGDRDTVIGTVASVPFCVPPSGEKRRTSCLDQVFISALVSFDLTSSTHSSKMTKVLGVNVRKISLVSESSTMNVDFPRSISSEAPIRLIVRSRLASNRLTFAQHHEYQESQPQRVRKIRSEPCKRSMPIVIISTQGSCLLLPERMNFCLVVKRGTLRTVEPTSHVGSRDDLRSTILLGKIDVKRNIRLVAQHLDLRVSSCGNWL